jgi:hypothetical protein
MDCEASVGYRCRSNVRSQTMTPSLESANSYAGRRPCLFYATMKTIIGECGSGKQEASTELATNSNFLIFLSERFAAPLWRQKGQRKAAPFQLKSSSQTQKGTGNYMQWYVQRVIDLSAHHCAQRTDGKASTSSRHCRPVSFNLSRERDG